jgi:hypothetical protein
MHLVKVDHGIGARSTLASRNRSRNGAASVSKRSAGRARSGRGRDAHLRNGTLTFVDEEKIATLHKRL